jgi:hypothetical protein
MAMLRRSSDRSLSGLSSAVQTRDPEELGRTHDPAVESEVLMEYKMSSQTFTHAHGHRSRLPGAVFVGVARHINDGLSVFARRFMDALHKSRQRQADRVIRRYRDLIDDSND